MATRRVAQCETSLESNVELNVARKVKRTFRMPGFAALFLVLLSACSSGKNNLYKEPKAEDYRIAPEDMIEVAVFQADGISRTLPVRPDGKITLPLVGEVTAAGKTAVELSGDISEGLKPYVQDPRVTVIVREINGSRIYVLGEVNHPGSYPLRTGTNVVQALALAGGFADFASKSSVLLIRKTPSGDMREMIDCDELIESEGFIPVLRSGDTLYVP